MSRRIGSAVLLLLIASLVHGGVSADISGDGFVDVRDFNIWNAYRGLVGATFEQGDIDGDGRVGILGDINAIYCQTHASLSPPSNATATAEFDEATGEGTIVIQLSSLDPISYFDGISAIYLLNESGTIEFTTLGFGQSLFTEDSNTQGLFPSAFGIAASAAANTLGTFNDVGPFGDFEFSVASGTRVEDLQFFYQRLGEELLPMPITSSVTGMTHMPELPEGFCSCPVPEPAMGGWFFASLALLTAAGRRHCR